MILAFFSEMLIFFISSSLSITHLFSLLKEAEIYAELREFELNKRRQMGLSASHHSLDNIEFDNKEDDQHDQRLLSQFGIWFLVRNEKSMFHSILLTQKLGERNMHRFGHIRR